MKEIRVLNKIVRYTATGIELEADPRHAEIVIRDLGLTDGKPSKVPGVKEQGDDKHRLEDEATKKHRRRVEAYNNIIRVYTSSDYPLSKEQQEEVDRLLEEAKNMDNEIGDLEEQEEKDEVTDQNNEVELDTEEARR